MNSKYSLAIRVIHWLMGVTILALIACGWFMSDLDDNHAYKWDFYKYHKTFGLVIFLLFFVRIVLRLKSEMPEYPKDFSKMIKFLSTSVHKILYFLMLAVPLTGILMSSLGGYGLIFFDYKLPNYFPLNKSLSGDINELHGMFSYILLALILLHIAGAVKHILIDKNNILKRII